MSPDWKAGTSYSIYQCSRASRAHEPWHFMILPHPCKARRQAKYLGGNISIVVLASDSREEGRVKTGSRYVIGGPSMRWINSNCCCRWSSACELWILKSSFEPHAMGLRHIHSLLFKSLPVVLMLYLVAFWCCLGSQFGGMALVYKSQHWSNGKTRLEGNSDNFPKCTDLNQIFHISLWYCDMCQMTTDSRLVLLKMNLEGQLQAPELECGPPCVCGIGVSLHTRWHRQAR